MPNKIIVIAGATGNLGSRIIKALLKRDVEFCVLVRSKNNMGIIISHENYEHH